MSCKHLSYALFLTTLLLYSIHASFEPYQLNGGLVAAVAGRDFCMVATDTRMSSGYEIYTRKHLSSRLWSTSTLDASPICCNSDGSLKLLLTDTTIPSNKQHATTTVTWIASAGCAADCEALKRTIRQEVNAASYYKTTLTTDNIATLLSQTLYARRGFPYYSFCVVAGFSSSKIMLPQVYVYDAIGSFEQVAVATAGTGREVLQPILDRLFTDCRNNNDNEEEQVSTTIITKTTRIIRVVDTHVTCTVDQALQRLVRGYKSVAERDVRVGDSVVFVITRRQKDGEVSCRVVTVPLKSH
jgi:20S proteasome subunit beta 6